MGSLLLTVANVLAVAREEQTDFSVFYASLHHQVIVPPEVVTIRTVAVPIPHDFRYVPED